jgi:hypothetical protein
VRTPPRGEKEEEGDDEDEDDSEEEKARRRGRRTDCMRRKRGKKRVRPVCETTQERRGARARRPSPTLKGAPGP